MTARPDPKSDVAASLFRWQGPAAGVAHLQKPLFPRPGHQLPAAEAQAIGAPPRPSTQVIHLEHFAWVVSSPKRPWVSAYWFACCFAVPKAEGIGLQEAQM